MKIMQTLFEHIENENLDAMQYAIIASEQTGELATVFSDLAKDEQRHRDILTAQAHKLVESYKAEGDEVPTGMQRAYEREHERIIRESAYTDAYIAKHK